MGFLVKVSLLITLLPREIGSPYILALSLRVEFSVYGAVFGFSACAAHTLIGRYIFIQIRSK
ncbi:hypothetical protein ELS82_25515 [Vibrio ouci]|uniref:Uncharacterized protein n=1 Tax=Vibrio ouci TaxID=2499078 RepID=A0A4Y8W8C4_9VIBR|nr:hypothetical protein ELS82_25515 [Vibrio ouci]